MCIVLSNGNNSTQVDILFHSDTFIQIPNQPVFLLNPLRCVLSREEVNSPLYSLCLNPTADRTLTRRSTLSITQWKWFLALLVVLVIRLFNDTFNNISIISWRSVLLVEETPVLREIHRHAASHLQTLSHNVVSSTHHRERDSNKH
jgi:hypothetical protein